MSRRSRSPSGSPSGRWQLGDTPEGQPVSVQGDGRPLRSIIGPRGGRQAGELISATPAQPSLLAVMVARLDDPDAVAARAVRLGQHGQSDSSVNPPPYLGFVVPPEHPHLKRYSVALVSSSSVGSSSVGSSSRTCFFA